MEFASLQDVFAMQLAELCSAESQLLDALPTIAAAASDRSLQDLLSDDLEETRRHRARLEDLIRLLRSEVDIPERDCAQMRSLINGVDAIAAGRGRGSVKDVALIAALQRIEHFEIASYGSARALARELFLGEAERSLRITLDEENESDRRLTKIATGGVFTTGINDQAAG
jgi:ferritin-like metal-binding protein YciE